MRLFYNKSLSTDHIIGMQIYSQIYKRFLVCFANLRFIFILAVACDNFMHSQQNGILRKRRNEIV